MIPDGARRQQLIEFVGRKTIRAACLLWSFGLVYLLLELLFAALLQHTLTALGLVSMPSNRSGRFFNLSLNQLIVLLIFVAVARALTSFAQVVVGGQAVEGFAYRIRRLLVEKSLRATSVKTAETLSFFNQRIYTASMAIQSAQVMALQGILTAGILLSLFWMSPLPTALLLLAVIAVSAPARQLNKRVKRSATMHAEALSKIMLHLHNVFRNFLLIRLFNLQRDEQSKILGHLKTYSDCLTQYYWMEGLSGALAPLVVVLTILWVALLQNTAVAIERSLAVPYLYLSLRLAQNLAPLVTNVSRLTFAIPEFRGAFRWWLEQQDDTSETFATAGTPQPSAPVKSAVGWRLSGVTFGYPDCQPLFESFSVEIVPGSLIRVRGASGVGKSTLVSLLVGEAVPSRGCVEVELDGEFSCLPASAPRLREHIGYSGTEPFLFEGTIYQNITYGLKVLPDQDFLLESTGWAECRFIFELPQQFEHRIDELGQGLSTGQKQRLSLLRALLRRPKALILDEALASVDVQTENRILTNLVKLKSECTILLISHRDHSGLASDLILELEESSQARITRPYRR